MLFNSNNKKLLVFIFNSFDFEKSKSFVFFHHIQIVLVSVNYHITRVNFSKVKMSSEYFEAKEVI